MTLIEETVDCPVCELEVPADRAADIETQYGPISVCKACHPTETA